MLEASDPSLSLKAHHLDPNTYRYSALEVFSLPEVRREEHWALAICPSFEERGNWPRKSDWTET